MNGALGRPNQRHIAELLHEDAELRDALFNATSADEAECYRQDLYAIQHSLWLAGWQPERED